MDPYSEDCEDIMDQDDPGMMEEMDILRDWSDETAEDLEDYTPDDSDEEDWEDDFWLVDSY